MENLENKRLYVAYGSNLNLEQMKDRCPTATVVAKGFLENYELVFRGERNSAFATIEPLEGSKVPVLLWDIKSLDEKNLDDYEEYPVLYRKEEIQINVDGEKVKGMAYIMNDREIGEPGKDYFDSILSGYKTSGFDLNILTNALEKCKKILEEKDNNN